MAIYSSMSGHRFIATQRLRTHSGAAYIMHTVDIPIKVVEPQYTHMQYVYATTATISVASIALAACICMKKGKK